MPHKTLNVTWHDHLQNLSGLFQDLYESKKLVDVSLYCSDGSLKAHKLVLSACSTYFAKIFEETDVKHPIIILRGISYAEMQQLLEFMYKGSINILENDLSAVIQAGSYLEIKGMDLKNVPNNLKNNLKRAPEVSATDLNLNTKKPKEKKVKIKEEVREEEEKDKMEIVESQSNNTTDEKDENTNDTATTEETPSQKSEPIHGRDTRFKGQKRVNVRGFFKMTKYKFNTSTPIKKSDEHKKIKTIKKEIDKETHDKEEDSTLKLVIKDVCSLEEKEPNRLPLKPNIKIEERDFDQKYEDEELIMPAVDLKESDSEIVCNYDNDGDGDGDGDNENPDGLTETDEHLQVNYLECSYCKKVFKTDNDLHCHIKVHTETKPFKCDYCDSRFFRSSHLARHRRMHTGERPFRCEECGQKFSRQDKLKLHCRTHEEYKPPAHYRRLYETPPNFKRARGRPKLYYSFDDVPKEKRPRGRPRKSPVSLGYSGGDPAENYDITNLPFGDFGYLTSALHSSLHQNFNDLTIIPVMSTTNSDTNTTNNTNIINAPENTKNENVVESNTDNATATVTNNDNSTNIETTQSTHDANPDKTDNVDTKTTELIPVQTENAFPIKQIGECTIQALPK